MCRSQPSSILQAIRTLPKRRNFDPFAVVIVVSSVQEIPGNSGVVWLAMRKSYHTPASFDVR